MSENDKKPEAEAYEAYEDGAELGQTMMDIGLKKNQTQEITRKPEFKVTEEGCEDIDQLLKNKRSLTAKIKGIFGKR